MATDYNPNAAANADAGIYGLPSTYKKAKVVYVPIPWEATTSYGGGTVFGPEAILQASSQLDLYDLDVKSPDHAGLFALPAPKKISALNTKAKKLAGTIKDAYGEVKGKPRLQKNLKEVNKASAEVNRIVYEQFKKIMDDGKIGALIGGDHSTPFGAFQAAAEKYGDYGILHFDAHSDTRDAYLGFDHSHASIMRNAATQIKNIKKFVQVGIRDFCQEEVDFTTAQKDRFHVFYDQKISDEKLGGKSIADIADEIIRPLPNQVWVSFDIDGLDPRYCPHTGTPVPGGLDYAEAVYILRKLAKSGRKIIGFDVVEVAPPLTATGKPIKVNQASDEWDANVGMRLIYKLTALTLASQKLADWR